jgi:rhodanese-related sulfurtransferase
MDARIPSVSSNELYARLGTASAPVLLDVRRDEAFSKDNGLIIGAFHRSPEEVEPWSKYLAPDHPVVAYCVHGHEVSQGVAARLHWAGIKASYLEGGIAGWRAAGLPTRKNRRSREQVDHSRASQDRPHRVPVADQPLHQSACRVPLRTLDRGRHARQGGRRDSL